MVRKALLLFVTTPALVMAAVPKADTDRPEKSADKQDRIICKTFPVIGSLVATTKECKTKRQWDIERGNLTAGSPIGSCAGPSGDGASACTH